MLIQDAFDYTYD